MTGIMQNTSPLGSPYIMFLTILSSIRSWKIFLDRGIPGWKSMIPCYGDYLLAKTIEEEQLGKKLAMAKGILLASLTCELVLSLSVLNTADPETGAYAMSNTAAILFLAFAIVMFAALIKTVIYEIRFCIRFVRYNNAQSWIAFIWIICPALALSYFAFVHQKLDIRGITRKKGRN